MASHPRFPLAALLCAAGLALTLVPAERAQAQMFKDPALQSLYADERTAELQRMAAPRVAARADDAQAVLALGIAALEREFATARPRALAAAEACIAAAAGASAAATPAMAPCHYIHGVLLGTQAMSEGMMAAARSAGKVRESFVAALEAEPQWHPARAALVDFYLIAPGFMGGSSSKAAELARSAGTPEQARALQARIALGDRKFDAALALLLGLPARLEPALAEDVRAWGMQAALGLVNAGKGEQAVPWFERLQRERPGHADGPYGLARVRAEAGAHEQAVKLYEQALAAKGAAEWPVPYRMGISLMALGRNDAAREQLKRFVATGRGQKASLEDARKRLEQLGG